MKIGCDVNEREGKVKCNYLIVIKIIMMFLFHIIHGGVWQNLNSRIDVFSRVVG